jgi:hypothetical protein
LISKALFHVKQFLFLFLFLPLFALSQIGTVQISNSPIPIPQIFLRQVDSLNRAEPYYSSLSSQEKEHYYWLNFSRTNPKLFWDSAVQPILDQFPNLSGDNANSLKQELSNNNILPRLSLNKTLIGLSKNQANDNLNQGRLNHTNSIGIRFDQRLKDAQIKRCAAENLVTGPPNMLFTLVLLYLDIGLPELGHRKNLLNNNYTEIGIGAATKSGELYFIVQDFACPQQ